MAADAQLTTTANTANWTLFDSAYQLSKGHNQISKILSPPVFLSLLGQNIFFQKIFNCNLIQEYILQAVKI